MPALDLLRAKNRSRLSLVDAISFIVMRRHQLERAPAFDDDFEHEGFVLPG